MKARKALDTWAPSTEESVAVAIEDSFSDGITFAVKFLKGKGEVELAKSLARVGNLA